MQENPARAFVLGTFRERTPRTYRHRGYVIEALPCGPYR